MIERLEGDAGDAYPSARNAVRVMGRPDAEWCWETYRRNDATLEELVPLFISIAANEPWAEETKTDDFRRFVAGKMGLM